MNMLKTLALLLFAVCVVNAQKTDKRVDEIRKIYNETNQRIADAEKQEQSDIFVVEQNVNKRLNPYPAVGIYASAAKFYYTYGDREKDPYPGRLLKIEVVVKRSATTTNGEFFYNVAGELIVGIVLTDGDEPREIVAYFSRGHLIKMIDNDKDVKRNLKTLLTAQALKAESVRLKGMFGTAIKEGF
jgi:hypothetical protein